MSAVVDPVRSFLELEKRLEREPASAQGEIARGVYMMTPRPRAAHGGVQANLAAEAFGALGLAVARLFPG